ncbi:manganese efflux pump MntP [Thalassobaculum sp.]|uniref:manganese efflux pump MntP n=1 Tax=Thalassobaculum sp. TaxID=2022740 RepID=UPI0032EFF9AD
MTLTATVLLAFGMSMDAFAAAIGKGATLHQPRFREALRAGAIFGFVAGGTPLIGWGLGLVASRYIAAWDHWIAFILLGFLGARMIYEGIKRSERMPQRAQRHSFGLLIMTAIATSLDAMAVGVSLAFLNVNILNTAAAIGLATLVMATAGVLVGRFLGPVFGRSTEVVGGLILIGIGANILIEHLSV